MTSGPSLKAKDRDAIIQSLRAGVVPRSGHQHIQVGRAQEVQALVGDIARVAEGGSGIRFVIGEYGSGKTFFLYLVRAIALHKRLVTMHADLTPDRRIYGTGGQARALYSELARNMATRANPDGGAMPGVVERFVTSALAEAREAGASPETVIHSRLESLSEMVGGYDFAEVIAAYWRGYDTGNEQMRSDAVRWLRGEFSTKTDARAALGVRTIVDDNSFYDQLKLLSRFVRLAGFAGLLVCLDELVNLFKMNHTASRNANYEQMLRILNDSLQGDSAGLGFLLAGTPEFLTDTRRGLYSYPALQSRLAENTFAVNGLVDLSSPVIRLAGLTQEDFLVLLTRLRLVFARGDEGRLLVPDQGLHAFMAHCSERIGEAYFRTPRNTIKAFLDMLAVLEQNPGVAYTDLLREVTVPVDTNPDLEPPADDGVEEEESGTADDELTTFRL